MPDKADAIIVGGSKTRDDMAIHAAELFHQGLAPNIVVSGYTHPTTGINEAATLRDALLSRGVPDNVILVEPNASNTGENILFSAKLLLDQGIVPKIIILSHKPYMTRRFSATAEAQWPAPQPRFYATSINVSFQEYIAIEEKRGLANDTLRLILNDYRSIIEYPKKGFQTKQPLSAEAQKAFQILSQK